MALQGHPGAARPSTTAAAKPARSPACTARLRANPKARLTLAPNADSAGDRNGVAMTASRRTRSSFPATRSRRAVTQSGLSICGGTGRTSSGDRQNFFLPASEQCAPSNTLLDPVVCAAADDVIAVVDRVHETCVGEVAITRRIRRPQPGSAPVSARRTRTEAVKLLSSSRAPVSSSAPTHRIPSRCATRTALDSGYVD